MLASGRIASFFLLAALLAYPAAAFSSEPPADDAVSFDLAAETWVSTQKATVRLNVEAAVSDADASKTRSAMDRAVRSVAKADWHMTNFVRSQDKTGLERWSVFFEARLADDSLNGLAEAVKKAGRPGMQIRVASIDFSPSLDEIEAARAALREQLLKQAAEQLAALNATLPGRHFRIGAVSFSNEGAPIPRPVKALFATNDQADSPALDLSKKIILHAHVVCAALPSEAGPRH
ncbi:MAG: hypothetical protein PHS57_04835 [Alphaproteobacteria bacterium]|nr:hypothetical protein [Alphaproteobacteria bacterium]